jgi:hypothetical protein
VPHLIDVFIDLSVFFDIGIGGGNIGFGLIIIVITDKKFDSILWKEFFKFAVQLGGQSLVMGDDQRGFLDFPEPVTPKRTWFLAPSKTPSLNNSMACG